MAETKTVDKLERNRHAEGVNGQNLIVHFAVIDVSVWEINLACVNTKGDDRSVVKDSACVENTNKWTIVGPGLNTAGGNGADEGPETSTLSGEKSTLPASKIRSPLLLKLAVRAPGPALVSLAEGFKPSRVATVGSLTSVRMYQTGTLPFFL